MEHREPDVCSFLNLSSGLQSDESAHPCQPSHIRPVAQRETNIWAGRSHYICLHLCFFAAAAAHIFTSAELLQDPHRTWSFSHQFLPLLFCFWGHLVLIKASDLFFSSSILADSHAHALALAHFSLHLQHKLGRGPLVHSGNASRSVSDVTKRSTVSSSSARRQRASAPPAPAALHLSL